MSSARSWLTALPVALVLGACSDSPRPYGDRTTAPAPPASERSPGGPTMTPPANTAAPAPNAAAPVVPPTSAEDVDAKKGSETGMAGGASGTTASGGKPGSGTEAGAGTGPAQSSGARTETNK